MDINIKNSLQNQIPDSGKTVERAQESKYNSVFDVHSNGVVDEGDFSQKDLQNNVIKNFLADFLNKEWSKEVENKVRDLLNGLNGENFEMVNGKYKLKFADNKLIIKNKRNTYEIKVNKDSTVTKNDIQRLFDTVSILSESEMTDFCKEIKEINLADEISFSGLGFFDIEKDTMELSTDKSKTSDGINKGTIVHELGHAVSALHGEKSNALYYSYDKELKEQFKPVDGIDILLEELIKEFGDVQALDDKSALFNEYQLYKQGLPTEYESEDLFGRLEKSDKEDIKNLLEILNNPIQKYADEYNGGIKDDEINASDAFECLCSDKFKGMSGIDYLFRNLQEKYGKFGEASGEYGDGYGLQNQNELFAEYYLYKNEGVTNHHSEKLFTELEKSENKDVQTLLKIMDSKLKVSKKDEKYRKSL